jgi:hypothetical protein
LCLTQSRADRDDEKVVAFADSEEPPVIGTKVRVGEHHRIAERRGMVGRVVGTYGGEELLLARTKTATVSEEGMPWGYPEAPMPVLKADRARDHRALPERGEISREGM